MPFHRRPQREVVVTRPRGLLAFSRTWVRASGSSARLGSAHIPATRRHPARSRRVIDCGLLILAVRTTAALLVVPSVRVYW